MDKKREREKMARERGRFCDCKRCAFQGSTEKKNEHRAVQVGANGVNKSIIQIFITPILAVGSHA